jgi:hypothetical protein
MVASGRVYKKTTLKSDKFYQKELLDIISDRLQGASITPRVPKKDLMKALSDQLHSIELESKDDKMLRDFTKKMKL